MVDLRKAARGQMCTVRILATAITIPKHLCWRITGCRGRAEQRQNHTICRQRLPVAHATI